MASRAESGPACVSWYVGPRLELADAEIGCSTIVSCLHQTADAIELASLTYDACLRMLSPMPAELR